LRDVRGELSVREHLQLFGIFKGVACLADAIDFFACIAIALLGNLPIVIMDEPTAGVDVQARQLIWKTIATPTSTTTIITSHALEEAETVSSRLFIVAHQRIPFCGTSTELRNEYQCEYLLRVDGTVGEVLDLARAHIPASGMSDERTDTIRLPSTQTSRSS
jgi:ABC-type multidrug transport system ATPase subunit